MCREWSAPVDVGALKAHPLAATVLATVANEQRPSVRLGVGPGVHRGQGREGEPLPVLVM